MTDIPGPKVIMNSSTGDIILINDPLITHGNSRWNSLFRLPLSRHFSNTQKLKRGYSHLANPEDGKILNFVRNVLFNAFEFKGDPNTLI